MSIRINERSSNFEAMPLETERAEVVADEERDPKPSFCNEYFLFHGNRTAQASGFVWWGHGGVVLSNVFLARSLIYLANEAAGCLDEEDEIDEDCTNKVYGMTPSNVVANIAVVSGLVVAFLLPVVGAVIDYTDRRRFVGALSVTIAIMIQAVQIGTTSRTWFAMSVLQAVALVLVEFQMMIQNSYITEIRKDVVESTLVKFCARFDGLTFGSELLFVIVITIISVGFNLSNVRTAQYSQAINVVWSGSAYFLAYRLFPAVAKKHELPEGRSLFTEGFKQVGRTARKVNKHYTKGLKWFFPAVTFAEAGASSIVVLSSVFLSDYLGLDAGEIGIFFVIALTAFIVGSKVAVIITNRTTPTTSYKFALATMCVVLIVSGLTIRRDTSLLGTFIFGASVGIVAGWYYPAVRVVFAMVQPKGQETEFAGFYIFCQLILGWAPSLVYSAMVEANIEQNYALLSLAAFFAIGVALISFAAPWDEIVEEAQKKVLDEDEDDDTGTGEAPEPRT